MLLEGILLVIAGRYIGQPEEKPCWIYSKNSRSQPGYDGWTIIAPICRRIKWKVFRPSFLAKRRNTHFHSDLSLDECLAKLKGSVRKKHSWIESGSTADPATVIGYFKGMNFQLVKKINYRNSFQPIFYGKLKIGNTGTVISGHFDIHPAVKAIISFMTAWVFSLFWFFSPKV